MDSKLAHPFVIGAPRAILRGEGLCLLAGAGWAYQASHLNWIWFGVLFLVPDISMLGFLVNPRFGALAYNAAHTTIGFGLIAAAGILLGSSAVLTVGLVGLAHVGFDRFVGYGLKYPSAFGHTHLGVVGKAGQ